MPELENAHLSSSPAVCASGQVETYREREYAHKVSAVGYS